MQLRLAGLLECVGKHAQAAAYLQAAKQAIEHAGAQQVATELRPLHASIDESHAGLLGCRGELLDGALELYECALEHRLADLTALEGQLRTAQQELQQASEHTRDHQPPEPPSEQQLACDRLKAAVSADSDAAASLLLTMATLGKHAHNLPQALFYLQRALELRIRAVGPRHVDTAVTVSNMGDVHRQLGNPGRALEYNLWALGIREDALGPGHKVTVDTRYNVALLQKRMGQLQRSLASFEAVEEALAALFGPEHAETQDARRQAERIRTLLQPAADDDTAA
jgi:tetratricopeptide (TPR) repeat protein